MSNISMVEAKLPPGFRFYPKDEELVCDYLMKKVNNSDSLLMVEVDLNRCEPWDLPEVARVGDNEWYFYSHRDRKYATGSRTNRATASGYWKATGKDRPILHKSNLVGMRKTLVFYEGRAPKGRKSDWVMHEFRLEGPFVPPNRIYSLAEDWVLCRVFSKNKETSLAKPSMTGSCYDDTGSSSLPALMDSYITFDQTQPNLYEYEQVPCFSMFSDNQPPDPILSHSIYSGPNPSLPQFGQLPMKSSAGTDLYPCDNKVITAVLDHITKMENNTNMTGSPSFGEGSSESYLSDVGIPSNLWKHC